MRLEPFLAFVVLLTGCHSAPHRVAPLAPPSVPLAAPSLELQEKTLRQQQQIQALIAQNEALLARVQELEAARATIAPAPEKRLEATPVAPPAPTTTSVVIAPPAPPAPPPEAELALVPNADGVIDLAALATAQRDGEEANPFAVRSLPADAIREVTLHVQGIVSGANPCALINDRSVQAAEVVESLTVLRVEATAVVFRRAGHLIRLPVSEKPARLRLPL